VHDSNEKMSTRTGFSLKARVIRFTSSSLVFSLVEKGSRSHGEGEIQTIGGGGVP